MSTYRGLVRSLARRQLGRCGDIDDGRQEVFVAIWRNADRYDPARGSEPAFVATLAQLKLIDISRRTTANRRLLHRFAVVRPHGEHQAAPGDDATRETFAAADRVLSELPPTCRTRSRSRSTAGSATAASPWRSVLLGVECHDAKRKNLVKGILDVFETQKVSHA